MSTRVEVKGRDMAREAYRIETNAGRAYVPECLMANALRPWDKPSHQDAYEWIAAHRKALILAVDRLAAGAAPRPPYDIMTLIEAR
ncbi:hypothetical protein ANTHELSMS3_03038 [Antarctobacter heliothermus]|uniref:Uncharacterized protein n=1 Tax=Antarctobacter heliothermus TaxID=74033 RepID=A0A222E6E2_9RHOB|nr:hypothetical protein [Antarctobacter heliothermus]ASP21690.1 hypothetical protein ANTHELSMS3_03038 [Antarctobacter heliothermus]